MTRPARPKINRYWKSPEVGLLRCVYVDASADDLRRLFPRHSLAAVWCKANELGLKKNRRAEDWLKIAARHVPTFSFGHLQRLQRALEASK